MIDEIFVSLSIVSKMYSPEYISNYLDMQPDKSWKINDYKLKTKIKEKNNGWVIFSPLDRKNLSISSHIEALFERIDLISEKILFLSIENHIYISCSAYTNEIPILYFDKEIINKISKLGGSLDIDLYI